MQFEYPAISHLSKPEIHRHIEKSGLSPCNFTSVKPTVQHSEHFFEFEYPVISSSSKRAVKV